MRRLRRLLPACAAGWLVLSPGRAALACSCQAPAPPAASVEQSDAVFAGTVTRVGTDDTRYEEATEQPGQRKYILKVGQVTAWVDVTKAWKGVTAPQVKVNTADNEAVCGYPFVVGRAYLFYGALDRHGEVRVSLCSRTMPLEGATQDLDALDQQLKAAERRVAPEGDR